MCTFSYNVTNIHCKSRHSLILHHWQKHIHQDEFCCHRGQVSVRSESWASLKERIRQFSTHRSVVLRQERKLKRLWVWVCLCFFLYKLTWVVRLLAAKRTQQACLCETHVGYMGSRSHMPVGQSKTTEPEFIRGQGFTFKRLHLSEITPFSMWIWKTHIYIFTYIFWFARLQIKQWRLWSSWLRVAIKCAHALHMHSWQCKCITVLFFHTQTHTTILVW